MQEKQIQGDGGRRGERCGRGGTEDETASPWQPGEEPRTSRQKVSEGRVYFLCVKCFFKLQPDKN